VDKVEGENQFAKSQKTLEDHGPENNSTFGFKYLPI
jgi:hypothetical protein